MTVTSFWALQFQGLRLLSLGPGGERSFVQSMAHSRPWANSSGGKSGARFERSCDGRFVTKLVSKVEFDMFVGGIAPAYLRHMHGTLVQGLPSMLVKVLGAYRVQVLRDGGAQNRRNRVLLTRRQQLAALRKLGQTQQHADAAAPGDTAGAADGGSAIFSNPDNGGGDAGLSAETTRGSTPSAADGMAEEEAPDGLMGAAGRQTHYVVVMEDLFHGISLEPGTIFDLKGKMRSQKKPPSSVAAVGAAAAVAAAAGSVASATARNSAHASVRSPVRIGDQFNPFSSHATLSIAATTAASSAEVRSEASAYNVSSAADAGSASSTQATAEGPAPLKVSNGDSFPGPLLADDPGASPGASGPGGGVVFFDSDLMSATRGFPLPLSEPSKAALDSALRRDCAFLSAADVIDYSLLVGVDAATGQCRAGIIDFLRRFDIVKRVENRVKAVAQLATNVEPTIVQPARYSERLIRACDRYFMGVGSVP